MSNQSVMEQYPWDDKQRAQWLEQIYQETITKVQDNITWYTSSARKKKRLAQPIRGMAISFLGTAGAIPVVIDVFRLTVPASLATLVAAAGAGLIALDRFMDYSSAWMRFLTTELNLKRKLDLFQYEWKLCQMEWQNGQPTIEQARDAISRMSAFRAEVLKMVNDETQIWVEDFKNSIRTLDSSARAGQNNRTGAVRITVENGELYREGWDLFVDDRLIGNYRGKSAALNALTPGVRLIRAAAKDSNNNKVAEAETAIEVVGTQVNSVTLGLEKPLKDLALQNGHTVLQNGNTN